MRTGYCGHSDHYPLCEKCQIEELESIRDELLEALSEIVDAADGDGWNQLDATFSKARAAIAKTRGEA